MTATTKRSDSAPYWAATLAIAIRDGDRKLADEARANLRRLGIPLDIVRPARPIRQSKGVARG